MDSDIRKQHLSAANEYVMFAMEILDVRKRCKKCYHNRTDTCLLQSCSCATDNFIHSVPRYWLSYEEGEKREASAFA